MNEIHIASCIVRAVPERALEVAEAIRGPSTEVVAVDTRGRIVVLVEGVGAGPVLNAIDAMRALPGVISANLIYQHAEDERALQEPIA